MYYGLDSRGYGLRYESDDPYGPDSRPYYERAAFYDGADDEGDLSDVDDDDLYEFFEDVVGSSIYDARRDLEARQAARYAYYAYLHDAERRVRDTRVAYGVAGPQRVLGSDWCVAGGDHLSASDRARSR